MPRNNPTEEEKRLALVLEGGSGLSPMEETLHELLTGECVDHNCACQHGDKKERVVNEGQNE